MQRVSRYCLLKLEEKNANMRALFSITHEKLEHKYRHILPERINAKAINESVRFDEINLEGPSSGF